MDRFNHTERFREQVGEIIPGTKTTVEINDSGTVTSAKINTDDEISEHQIEALRYLKSSWWFKNMTLKRSGAGIRISFSEVKKSQ